MNFRCDDTLLQMYVDGALAPAERAIIEAHIQNCPQCRQQVTLYKGLLWDLEHPADDDPAPAELSDLSDRLMEAWAQSRVPVTWQETSLQWTQTVPVVQVALATAGRVGRNLPRAGLSGLSRVGRWLWKGGGRG